MEGGVWEVPPCCPHVQGGRGGPLRLYGVWLVVSAMGDEDVGGRQLIHLCGVEEVAGDGDLGGVVFAVRGVGHDVVGRPFVVGGVFCRVRFEWGMERFRRWGSFFGFRVWCDCGLTRYCDLHASGAPTWLAAAAAASRGAVVLVSWGGGGLVAG